MNLFILNFYLFLMRSRLLNIAVEAFYFSDMLEIQIELIENQNKRIKIEFFMICQKLKVRLYNKDFH